MEISAVLFDLDETLLDRTTSLVAFLHDQHARFADRLGNGTFASWRDRFLELDARGHVHKSIVYPAILSEFRGDASLAEVLLSDYQSGCSRFARPFEGMVETLQTLRAQDLRLGIVTNGDTDFQARHVAALGLDRLVDAVLISQAEGLRKPEKALFDRAADRLEIKPERCLFVGDNPVADIWGAAAAGMKTAWFRCGQKWPNDLSPNPGFTLERLSDLRKLLTAIADFHADRKLGPTKP